MDYLSLATIKSILANPNKPICTVTPPPYCIWAHQLGTGPVQYSIGFGPSPFNNPAALNPKLASWLLWDREAGLTEEGTNLLNS